jgi:hypothetical protein
MPLADPDATARMVDDDLDVPRHAVVAGVDLSRIKILGRAVESVLKENRRHGKIPLDSC